MVETGTQQYPYPSFNFVMEIDNVAVAGFSEVSGLSGDSDIIEYREGADKELAVRKQPGRPKFQTNLTLKRGLDSNRELWRWRKNILEGRTDRRNGAIVLLDELRNRVVEWRFRNGWISKYEGPALNAKGNEAAVETAEIVIESLVMV